MVVLTVMLTSQKQPSLEYRGNQDLKNENQTNGSCHMPSLDELFAYTPNKEDFLDIVVPMLNTTFSEVPFMPVLLACCDIITQSKSLALQCGQGVAIWSGDGGRKTQNYTNIDSAKLIARFEKLNVQKR